LPATRATPSSLLPFPFKASRSWSKDHQLNTDLWLPAIFSPLLWNFFHWSFFFFFFFFLCRIMDPMQILAKLGDRGLVYAAGVIVAYSGYSFICSFSVGFCGLFPFAWKSFCRTKKNEKWKKTRCKSSKHFSFSFLFFLSSSFLLLFSFLLFFFFLLLHFTVSLLVVVAPSVCALFRPMSIPPPPPQHTSWSPTQLQTRCDHRTNRSAGLEELEAAGKNERKKKMRWR